MVEGFQRGLLVGAIFLAAGALIGLRTTNTHELQEAAA